MKKSYQQPAMRVVQLQHRHHILAGSGELYSVKNYDNGGTETVSDNGDW